MLAFVRLTTICLILPAIAASSGVAWFTGLTRPEFRVFRVGSAERRKDTYET